ncbi:NAD(P)/FAD-dependent oxidoreductase [Mesobacillus harenae]|uniref:NAD(P)/FAD-dependent oxidoreductase n=1 Tax=Mesobacillus harenae TaxID=2213203 RepID=UPI00157FD9FB|nr:FAD-dependent oxidoreductase [Mesobacillus harenae]
MKKIIVIGAGILGASTAYQLVKSGAEVLIVDRNDKGQATDAAAGIICPWLSQRRNMAWYELAKAGARFYPSLVEELEKDGEIKTGYAKVGALSLQKDPEKLGKMAKRGYARRENAPEVGQIHEFDQQKTISLFPPLDDEFSSVYVSGGARVDGRALRNSLLSAAQKHGATLINGDASLSSEENTITGVHVGNDFHKADSVIVCAGAWAAELFKPLGVNFKVTFQKAQIAHLKIPDANTEKWPVVMPPGSQYLLAFENGRMVAGATHEDTDQFDARITAGGLQEIFNKVLETAPGLADSTFVEARSGFRPFTPGYLPVIGPLPGWTGIFVANGLGASGLTMGPYIGAELAKLALGQDLEINLENYPVAGALEN